jgi:hypothetical protein
MNYSPDSNIPTATAPAAATTTTTTTTTGAAMVKVFSHDTSGGLFSSKADALRKNPGNHDEKLFSILGNLENFRLADGSFHLKMCYPELTSYNPPCNEWIQTSNPATESAITGFRAINLAFPKNSRGVAWEGLALSSASQTLIDESPDDPIWWWAIGAMSYHSGPDTITGPKNYKTPYTQYQIGVVKKVELWTSPECPCGMGRVGFLNGGIERYKRQVDKYKKEDRKLDALGG